MSWYVFLSVISISPLSKRFAKIAVNVSRPNELKVSSFRDESESFFSKVKIVCVSFLENELFFERSKQLEQIPHAFESVSSKYESSF